MNATTPALAFQGTEFNIVKRDHIPWLRLSEIGAALGYADGNKALSNIYARHADEFTAAMTRIVKLSSAGGKQAVRIFSLRGAHLLAMFARTDRAKAFRQWVLDVLDREVAAARQTPRAPVLDGYTLETLEALCNEVHFMGSWWKRYGHGIEVMNRIAYGRIFERFLFAPSRAKDIQERLGLRSLRQIAAAERWEK